MRAALADLASALVVQSGNAQGAQDTGGTRSDLIPAFSVMQSRCFSSAGAVTGSGLLATPTGESVAFSCASSQRCNSPRKSASRRDALQCFCQNASNSTSRIRAIRLSLTLERQNVF